MPHKFGTGKDDYASNSLGLSSGQVFICELNITPRKVLRKLIIACVDTLSWCLSKSGGGGINKDL